MARRTPLFEAHRSLGARIVEFGGWEMPLAYANAAVEHRAVRTACGLFDVSHMGEFEISGKGALALCQKLTVNDVARLPPGTGQYTLFCNERGGIVDDLIIYCISPERYLLVVNASTTDSDLSWIRRHTLESAVAIEDKSEATSLLALQGPEAARVLADLAGTVVCSIPSFSIAEVVVAGYRVRIARTGYTGEDGFEIFSDGAAAVPVWEALLRGVRARDGMACGLAARDTLRLEAGLPLYGSDLDETTSPIEAGLAWVVKLSKGTFLGREVLAGQVAHGTGRRLAAFILREPGVPRHGCRVLAGDADVGVVTSGAKTPTLEQFIGLAYVRSDVARPGTDISIDVRGHRLAGSVVAKPFYRRPAIRQNA